jgi:hypothetical protein
MGNVKIGGTGNLFSGLTSLDSYDFSDYFDDKTTINYSITSDSTNEGTGYAINDVISITFAQGITCTCSVTSVDANGAVKQLTLLDNNLNNNFIDTTASLSTTGGSGTGLKVNINSTFANNNFVGQFQDCASLNEVYLDPAITNVVTKQYLSTDTTSLYSNAFVGCSSLQSIYINSPTMLKLYITPFNNKG